MDRLDEFIFRKKGKDLLMQYDPASCVQALRGTLFGIHDVEKERILQRSRKKRLYPLLGK